MAYLEELLPEFRKGAKIRLALWEEGQQLRDDAEHRNIVNDKGEDADSMGCQLSTDRWELYREPEPDWEYIIKNKCLCWFWCEGEEERRIAGLLADYDSYNSQFGRYKGKNVAVTYFDHCRPVRRDEVTFYEDKKDEILTSTASYERGEICNMRRCNL